MSYGGDLCVATDANMKCFKINFNQSWVLSLMWTSQIINASLHRICWLCNQSYDFVQAVS